MLFNLQSMTNKTSRDSAFQISVTTVEEQGIPETFSRLPQTERGIIINKLRTERFQSITILNKLSGKALTVEDSSTNQDARIEQLTRSDAPNQRWFRR